MAVAGRLAKPFAFLLLAAIACGESSTKSAKKRSVEEIEVLKDIKRPDFNSDSAYAYIEKQVSFGPRVPNTQAHKETAEYLAGKLESFGFNVINQRTKVTAFDGTQLDMVNIIGEYLPGTNNRILLFAHWDTRPFADQSKKNKSMPIDGANDGASGVGILLEVARQIQLEQPKTGIDIIFFDAEDYGEPSGSMHRRKSTSSWCLGSQYWAKNPHRPYYMANFGILLDMVGGKNATFAKESISMHFAPYVMNKVWKIAHALGHNEFFIDKQVQFVGEDDHLYVNKVANIPSIDIIHYDQQTGSFNKTWHTHEDNMDFIDRKTLQAVGETVLATVLSE